MKYALAIAMAIVCANSALIHEARAQEAPAAFFANDPYAPGKAKAPPTAAGTQTSQDGKARRASNAGALSNASHIDAAARRHGVPVRIARATVRIESHGRCNARGRHGELGPLQIKLSTARGLGYRGSAAALATCGAGLEWGMRHLAIAIRMCGHVGPHNYGLAGGCRKTGYVRKVMALA